MPLTSRIPWNFREFWVLPEDLQQEMLLNRFEERNSLNSVVYAEAFLKEQSKSNGEWFDIDAFAIADIHADHNSCQVQVLFDYSASAYEQQVQQAPMRPIRGRAVLVIHEDGSEQIECLFAEVISPDEEPFQPRDWLCDRVSPIPGARFAGIRR